MYQVDLSTEASFVSVWVATCIRKFSQPLGPAGASLAAAPPIPPTPTHRCWQYYTRHFDDQPTPPPPLLVYITCSETYRCSLGGHFFMFGIFSTSVCFPGWVGICLAAILAEVDWSGYTCPPPRLSSSSLNLCLVGGAYRRRRAFESYLGIYKTPILLQKFELYLPKGLKRLLPDASLDSEWDFVVEFHETDCCNYKYNSRRNSCIHTFHTWNEIRLSH